MRRLFILVTVFSMSDFTIAAQQNALPAVDVTAKSIESFIRALPADAVSDRPIRVVDVGSHRVGVWGVRRPQNLAGAAVLHEVKASEVYYMLTGTGTLVTGGTLVDRRQRDAPAGGLFTGSRIEGGVTRKVGPGDVVVIPPNTPHWWSSLDGEVTYLIIRSDPEGRFPLR
jgi:mannose-6-phosphate isomerase-like protein (cupin superfamily)